MTRQTGLQAVSFTLLEVARTPTHILPTARTGRVYLYVSLTCIHADTTDVWAVRLFQLRNQKHMQDMWCSPA
jgi:hypothetical protein